MPGNVAGGVSPRRLQSGQVTNQVDDILAGSVSLMQAGGGAYPKLIDALQSLNQAENILALSTSTDSQAAAITALQQVTATMQTQIFTLQGQVTSLQNQINTINTRLANAGIP